MPIDNLHSTTQPADDMPPGEVLGATPAPVADEPPGAVLGSDQPPGDVVAGGKPPEKDDEGFVSKAWNWATRGLLGQDTIQNVLGRQVDLYSGLYVSRHRKPGESFSQTIDRLATAPVVDPLEEKYPWLAGIRTAAAGMVRDTAKADVGFTSPVGIATLAAGPASEVGGAVGTLAKTATSLAGAEFAREGISSAASGVGKIAQAGNVTSEQGIQGLGETLSGLGNAAFAAHGETEKYGPAAARYVNAVRESAADVTGGLATRGKAVLSERALAAADADASKIDVQKALGKAADLGVIDTATRDHIAKIAEDAPEKAARVLHAKLSNDGLGNAAPRPDLLSTATEDGKVGVMSIASLPQSLRDLPAIKEVLEKADTSTMPAQLSKSLDGDTLEHINASNHPEVSNALSKIVENHVYRTAQSALDPTDYLKKLKSGYDKINPGVMDANPDIRQNANTVNDLLRLKNKVDTLQTQFPHTDIASWVINGIKNATFKTAAMNILGGIFGYETLGLGGTAALMGVKYAAQQTPVIRAMTNAMGSLSEALRPKVDVPTTVGIARGTVEAPTASTPEVTPHMQPEANVNATPPPPPTGPHAVSTPQEPELHTQTPAGQPATTSKSILEMANDYNKARGGPELAPKSTPQVDARAQEIADAYEAAEHNPTDAKTAKSYAALKDEVRAQWDWAVKNGITFEPWNKEGQPYTNSSEMMRDVANNKHLYFYQGGDIPADHPLAQVDPQTGLTYNDMFRAVHDLFGHAMHGFQFGPRGEEGAFQAHSQMFSPEAQPAMFSETKAQNSWVNSGAHLRDAEGNIPKKGEPGYVAPADRPFAAQKATILPQATGAPAEPGVVPAEGSPLANAEPVDTAKGQLAAKPRDVLLDRINASRGMTPQQVSQMMHPTVESNVKSTDNWFSGSQVRVRPTSSREIIPETPLTVYHGTKGDIDSFQTGRETVNDWGFLGPIKTERHGIFFAENPEYAKTFSKAKGSEHIIPAQLSIKNPFYMDNESLSEDYGKAAEAYDEARRGDDDAVLQKTKEEFQRAKWLYNLRDRWEVFDGPEGKEFVQALKARGYDGAFLEEEGHGLGDNAPLQKVWVAFDPSQIRKVPNNEYQQTPEPASGKPAPTAQSATEPAPEKPAPKYKSFHGTYATRAAADEVASRRAGAEVFEHSTGPNKGKFGVGVPIEPTAPQTRMTVDEAIAQHIKEHPEDAEKPAFENFDSFTKNHPEINSFDGKFSNNEVLRTKVLGHELAHVFVADRLGIPVKSIQETPRGASVTLDVGAVQEKWGEPQTTSNILTALTGNRAAYLSTLAAGGLGERALGHMPEMGNNWEGGIVGSDRWMFNQVLDSLGISKPQWDGIWEHHVGKAQEILDTAPDFSKHAETLAHSKDTVSMSNGEINDFLNGLRPSRGGNAGRAVGTPEERVNFLDPKEVKDFDSKKVARKVSSMIEDSIANAEKEGHDNIGVTYNPSRAKNMGDSGEWAVSAFPERTVTMKNKPSAEQIQKFIETNRDLYKDPTNNVGIWRSTEGRSPKWYLDVTNTHPDQDFATYVGQRTNQIGITHLDGKDFEFVPTEGNGKYTGDEGYTPAAGRINDLYKDYVAEQPNVSSVGFKQTLPEQGEYQGLLDITQALQERAGEQANPLKPGTDVREAKLARATQAARDEARYQLAQDVNGQDWYHDDLQGFEKTMKEVRPELQNPLQMRLYKTIVALTSPGQSPVKNLGVADKIYDAYRTTGKIPSMAVDSSGQPLIRRGMLPTDKGKSYTGPEKQVQWGPQIGPYGFEVLNKLISERGGERPALDWLTTKHPVDEVLKYSAPWSSSQRWVKSAADADGNVYGSLAFGPKVGRFTLNLNDIHDELTADRWMSRTWNRWMGTMLDDKGQIVETPRNPDELKMMQDSVASVAKSLGMTVDQLQATLWYYEKALYRSLGHDEPTESYSDAAQQLRERRGSAEPQE